MGDNGSKGRQKTGSHMSTKQLAHTVKEGRKVVFHFPYEERIEGYLCGIDDYHWMIITPEGQVHLVHKGSVAVIDLPFEKSYESEEKLETLEGVVGPFRAWVEKEFYSRAPRQKEAVG